VARIRPGQRIFIGTGCAEPLELVRGPDPPRHQLPDTEIVHLLTFGEAPYAHRELAQYFRVNSFFIAENVRDIIQEGLGDYTPMFLSDIPRLFDSGQPAAGRGADPGDPAGRGRDVQPGCVGGHCQKRQPRTPRWLSPR
jgi:acyl-CoA hydrolase